MKTTLILKTSAILAMAMLLAFSHTVTAQRYNQKRKFYIGLEGGFGTRSLKLKTDIEALKGMSVQEEGYNLGLLIGGDVVRANIRKGFYKSSSTTEHRIDMDETELGMNIFPLQIGAKRTRYFRPYLSAGLMLNNVTFYGSYALPDPLAKLMKEAEGEQQPCCCDEDSAPAPGGPMADPDNPAASNGAIADTDSPVAESDESNEAGKISDVRLNVGGGVMLMVPMQRTFIKLFAEVKYGMPLATVPWSTGFLNTRISNPLLVNFGIGIGLKN